MKTKILIIAVIVLFIFGCKKSSTTPTPPTNEVYLNNMQFNPASLTVTAGTTVKWINKESVTHTVSSDVGVFESGDMGNGTTFSHTFSSAGTYPYHCKYHSGMKAAVIVQ